MARENQGLQIALIIFVMLTVVMSVMWFFYFKKYDETDRKAQVAVDHAVQADAQRLQTEAESKELKRHHWFCLVEDDPGHHPPI